VPRYDPQTGTGKTWPAIAFGFLAVACKDPCTCAEQGVASHQPTMNHPMLFDGNVWRELRSGRGTALTECPPSWVASPPEIAGYEASMQDSGGGACGNFSLGGGTHRVYLKLTTDRILIWMMTRNSDATQNQYCGAFERVYKGPFNRVAFGVGPGCELQDKMIDGDSYTCKPGGTPKQCLTYTSDRADGTTLNYTDGYWRAQVDSMSLLDGQLVHHTFEGACCKNDGSCEVMLDSDCAAAGGSFSGPGTVCDADACTGACCQPQGVCTHTTIAACPGSFLGLHTTCTGDRQCCPTPYADWDLDQDVDMTDFGGLQECLTLGGGTIQPGCVCFDHNRDNAIDETDIVSFIECATGPAAPAAPVPPACAP